MSRDSCCRKHEKKCKCIELNTDTKAVFGQFSSNENQVLNNQEITFNRTDASYGVSLRNETDIRVEKEGVYSFSYSAQAGVNPLPGSDIVSWTANFWLTVNGVPVPNSTVRVNQSSSLENVPVNVSRILQLKKGDLVQLFASGSATAADGTQLLGIVAIQPLTEPIEPDSNSINVSVHRLGARQLPK